MPPVNRVPVERVRQLLAQGVTPKNIALRLGCSLAGLCTALKRMRREGVL